MRSKSSSSEAQVFFYNYCLKPSFSEDFLKAWTSDLLVLYADQHPGAETLKQLLLKYTFKYPAIH